MMSKVYVTTMYRWGDREKHSYVLGVYHSSFRAILAGVRCHRDRGFKYDPEVIKFKINDMSFQERILRLEDYDK